MQIINLLDDQILWKDEKTFERVLQGLQYFDSTLNLPNQVPNMLEKSFFMADQSLKLSEEENIFLKAEIVKAIHLVKNDFPKLNSEIVIFGTSERNKFLIEKMDGVGGYAAEKALLLYLQPKAQWRKGIFRTALHELNHTARYKFEHPLMFLNWTVLEGLAELYVSEKCPQDPLSPWAQSASVEQINSLLPLVKKFWLNSEMPKDAQEWFYGSKEKAIPLWFGYSLGFYIVKSFRVKNPALSWIDLISIPSKIIAEAFI
ncbi:MAG: DUF2268 domain-containing putative Zn-dependent protease [Bdellovibrio sp.]